MPIKVLFNKNVNPWHNIAWEEYLLQSLDKNSTDVYLYFYENTPSIILGASLNKMEEVYEHKQSIPPVLRRISGGGSVVHLKNNINYGIVFSLNAYPNFFKIHESYSLILGSITNVCKNTKHPIFSNGHSDLTMIQAGTERKISGNSQARKGGFLLHHGTFLCKGVDTSPIRYFLRPPVKQPEYREKRRHEDFLLKVSPFSKTEVIQIIMQSVQNLFNMKISAVQSFTKNQFHITEDILTKLYR